MKGLDALDKFDTYRWVSFLMDTAVLIGGSDTKKALIFLSDVIATMYIIRGNGAADEFVMDLAAAIHEKVGKYIETKETHFTQHAKIRMEKDTEAVAVAKLTQLMLDELLPSSGEVKKDSVMPIFAGVYMSNHEVKSHPMIMALCLCVSYVLADTQNTQDVKDMSVFIMDAIIDKKFQKTVKHLVEFEDKFSV